MRRGTSRCSRFNCRMSDIRQLDVYKRQADGVPREGGGGEYPLQDGFGWTNGVVRRLIG